MIKVLVLFAITKYRECEIVWFDFCKGKFYDKSKISFFAFVSLKKKSKLLVKKLKK